MRSPPPLVVDLAVSRTALALVALASVATAALVALLSLPAAVKAAALGAVAVIGARGGASLRTPRRLVVGLDRRIAVTAGDGTIVRGEIGADSYVAGRVATIAWRPDGARYARTLLLLPDALPDADFRRLRVALRYGRPTGAVDRSSGVDAG